MEPLAESLLLSVDEPQQFEVVFREQFNPLLNRLVSQVFDAEVAVDIAAETLAAAFIQRSRFRGTTDAEVIAWLRGIADRKLAMFFRKSRVEKRALDRMGIEPPVLSEEEHREVLRRVDAPALREIVRSSLVALSEAQRTALTLRVVDEMPYPDVARQLGISEEATRARVARGLAVLRRKLRNHPGLTKEAT